MVSADFNKIQILDSNPTGRKMEEEAKVEKMKRVVAVVVEEEEGRRLKRRRKEIHKSVNWVPESWGKDSFLKEWKDCAVIDRSLFPPGLAMAREALVKECRERQQDNMKQYTATIVNQRWRRFSCVSREDVCPWILQPDKIQTSLLGYLVRSSGVLMITHTGNLNLVKTDTNTTVWSSNTTVVAKSSPKAHILDTGNFIVAEFKYSKVNKILWQSFDYPTDTMLPTMKLGLDLRIGLNRFLTSWKSENDPSTGEHTYEMDTKGSHEIYLKSKNIPKYRLGPWNGKTFSGFPGMKIYEKHEFKYVSNDTDAYYTFEYGGEGVISRLVMNPSGKLNRLLWNIESKSWGIYWSAPNDHCDDYSRCGPNGLCDISLQGYCKCLRGFTPKSLIAWKAHDFRMGCKPVLEEFYFNATTAGQGFLLLKDVKYPDITNSTIDTRIDLDECRSKCLANCNCTAFARYYTATAIRNGEPTGCIVWYGELFDIRKLPFDGQNIYLKVPSELSKEENRKVINLVIMVISSISAIGILLGVFIWKRKNAKKKKHAADLLSKTDIKTMTLNYDEDNRKWKIELNIFEYLTLASATNNFSKDNKIGQGGFGVVYKGKLHDGQEIAVKRLSMVEGHGIHEKMFINEAGLIANCQHKNLVRLLGCCMEGDERMLVFEFMRNKSLNTFIFGEKRHLLDWKIRVEIILGVSKGLLYLHEDARFKIIHRDIKAGNVLLDEALNPKITDFGTAKLFGSEIVEETTNFIMSCSGYMSPEYAMEGVFSPKSDVFSFGVLLLEIISGRKVLATNHNLLDIVWKLYKDRRSFELLDKTISCPSSMSQVMRFIQIGLLCTQEYAADRPDISTVVFMLSNENSPIPEPTTPGFCKLSGDDHNVSTSKHAANYITITTNYTR
ncbi:S-locus receptor kinase (SRK) [Zostera marina]|uniref:Receptor-like serine/threonine-protein kinase n=1 Tax=Zostera marina TaxID=29655 RepID=A0A0K9PG70_ZOSMR|nr:S-locus receptor kinase (SRK) [Zostera marina]